MSGTIIIGAGECGARASFALRENGYNDKITLVGNEKHLPYERPYLSKTALDLATTPKYIASKEQYDHATIDLSLDSAVSAIHKDEQYITYENGKRQAYDQLILATGARPRLLPDLDYSSPHVATLRTYEDAQKIHGQLAAGKHFVILGGGFIGLEVAAMARQNNVAVTVLEMQPRLLQRAVNPAIAQTIEALHKAHNVALHFNITVTAIKQSLQKITIDLQNGASLEADLLLIGIGAIPNTELAQKAGLAVDNGICVDAFLRTSAENIWAAGDCCSFPNAFYSVQPIRLESWRNAQQMGNIAAANICGATQKAAHVPWFWSDQYDHSLQIAGLIQGTTQNIRRQGKDYYIEFHLDDSGALKAASGIGLGNKVAKDIRLAEMLIESHCHPDPAALANADINLKSLIKRAAA